MPVCGTTSDAITFGGDTGTSVQTATSEQFNGSS